MCSCIWLILIPASSCTLQLGQVCINLSVSTSIVLTHGVDIQLSIELIFVPFVLYKNFSMDLDNLSSIWFFDVSW